MKRFLIGALCMCGLISGANAQDIFDSGEMTPYFGARVSLDITGLRGSINNNDIYNNGCGFTIGGYYNIPLYKNLYFEPGLGIFYNTIGYNYSATYGNEQLEKASVDGSLRNWGFRVPLLVGYHFDFTDEMKVSVFTGPQFNYGLSLRDVYDIKTSGHTEHVSESVYSDYHRLDVQWAFGAQYHYKQYTFGLTGALGITNLVNEKNSPKGFRNTMSISVGYRF